MVLVLLVLSIVVLFVGIWICRNGCVDFIENTGIALGVIGGIVAAICIIAAVSLGISVSQEKTFDAKISLYQEQNAQIEDKVGNVVAQYMEHEANIIMECAPSELISLVSLYPELQSDALISQQIELYIENNNRITRIKEKQINLSVCKWWLYFGG